jgi:hypothetical protein
VGRTASTGMPAEAETPVKVVQVSCIIIPILSENCYYIESAYLCTAGTLNIIIRVSKTKTHLAAILCEQTTGTPTRTAAAATGPAAVPAFCSTA